MNKIKLIIVLFITTLSIASFAYGYPSRTNDCSTCHGEEGVYTNTASATPSKTALEPGEAYTVFIQIENTPTGYQGGFHIQNPDGSWGPYDYVDTDGTYTQSMTAPSEEGSYTYTVWVNWGPKGSDGNPGLCTYTITVTAPPPPPLAYGADLVKKSAWPEHHHFDRSAEQGRGEDLNNNLYGLVRNTGAADVNVKVVFTIYKDKDGSSVGEIETEPYFLTMAEYEHVLTKGFDVTIWGDGKFKIKAQAWYQDPADGLWKLSPDSGIKSFGFAVVP